MTFRRSLIVIAPPGGSDAVVHVTGPAVPAVVHDAPEGADALTLASLAVHMNAKLSVTTTSSASLGPSLVMVAVNSGSPPIIVMPEVGCIVVERSACHAA